MACQPVSTNFPIVYPVPRVIMCSRAAADRWRGSVAFSSCSNSINNSSSSRSNTSSLGVPRLRDMTRQLRLGLCIAFAAAATLTTTAAAAAAGSPFDTNRQQQPALPSSRTAIIAAPLVAATTADVADDDVKGAPPVIDAPSQFDSSGPSSSADDSAVVLAGVQQQNTQSLPHDSPVIDTSSSSSVLPVRHSSDSNSRSNSSSKLANFRQRAIPATALLVGLYGITRTFHEAGLTVLLLALSPGLYYEAVSVLDSHHSHPVGLDIFTNKWWWFAAYSFATTIPRTASTLLLQQQQQHDTGHAIASSRQYHHTSHLVSYGMVVTGFMAWILRLNKCPAAPAVADAAAGGAVYDDAAAAQQFLTAWHELAAYHMGIAFTLIPVAFWMAVLADYGTAWALYAALLVILNDTLAYAFGVAAGKSALLPAISPKKTWEGFGGALVATLALSRPLWALLFSKTTVDHCYYYSRHSLAIALFCCVVAPFGGFVASSIKRAANKKDFGDCIAGHGGLVDRLDCQLVAGPFVYLYLQAAAVARCP